MPKGHKSQQFTFDVDENYTPSEREEIAEQVIDEIVGRTLSGKDKNGRPLKALSADYAAFKKKAVGSGKANLKFSGEMLGALGFVRSTKGSITVGYSNKNDPEQNAKAKGHISGDVAGKPRDFLGLPQKHINSITRGLPPAKKTDSKAALEAALALRRILRGEEE